MTPEKPPTPYLARLTAQACSAKAIAQGKPGLAAAKSFSKLDSSIQTERMIELYDKGKLIFCSFFGNSYFSGVRDDKFLRALQ